MQRDEILQQALALSPEDRFFLLEKIDASLPQPPGVMTDDELNGEIERRCEAYERGEMKAIDWEDAKAGIQEKLNELRGRVST